MTLEMRVTSVFHIQGRGTVLAGEIAHGSVDTGQWILVATPAHASRARILGIERTDNGELVARAGAGDAVALQTGPIGFDELADGITRDADGVIMPLDLYVRAAPRPWWQFW